MLRSTRTLARGSHHWWNIEHMSRLSGCPIPQWEARWEARWEPKWKARWKHAAERREKHRVELRPAIECARLSLP